MFSQRSEQFSVLSFGLSLHLCVGLRALAIEITCIALQISSQAMFECQAGVSDVEWVWFELV